jgi:large subunit ribosomal protein L35
MPKIKTHKGLSKRVKVGAKGAVKRKRAGGSHLMSSKNGKVRRRIRRRTIALGKEAKTMRRALGKG